MLSHLMPLKNIAGEVSAAASFWNWADTCLLEKVSEHTGQLNGLLVFMESAYPSVVEG